MYATSSNEGNEKHLIFFHGVGDDYKNVAEFCKDIQAKFTYLYRRSNFYVHAHKYPTTFQNYITYAVASFLCLGASILPPIVILLTNSITVGLAVLATLACVFLSILLLMVPFINRNQSLSKSSVEKINQLIDEGVKPGNIILFGHSFGGAITSEVSKHFADRNVELGGIIFISTFSSFYAAIKHFPIPQAKILSVLPSFLLKKMLKALNLDFDIVNNIQKLQSEKMPIVVINHERDCLIPQLAQLAYAVENGELLHGNLIKTVNLGEFEEDPHNEVLYSEELSDELTEIVLNRVNQWKQGTP